MSKSDEARLIENLRLVEALHAGATTDGERGASERARERILARLAKIEKEDPPIEFRFSMDDRWSRSLFTALLRRYDIEPYRYKRQRHTTVMARVPKRFVNETLWPEYCAISERLSEHLHQVTRRIVSEALGDDGAEPEVMEQGQLSLE